MNNKNNNVINNNNNNSKAYERRQKASTVSIELNGDVQQLSSSSTSSSSVTSHLMTPVETSDKRSEEIGGRQSPVRWWQDGGGSLSPHGGGGGGALSPHRGGGGVTLSLYGGGGEEEDDAIDREPSVDPASVMGWEGKYGGGRRGEVQGEEVEFEKTSHFPKTGVGEKMTRDGLEGSGGRDRSTLPPRSRLVLKDGSCNMTSHHITSRNRKYLVDIFTTLVDLRWRYNVLMFTSAFVLSWLLFAVIWYIIALAHGDIVTNSQTGTVPDEQLCMVEVYDFRTALLFSIETQHTIGYGSRSMQPNCPEAFIVLMIQSCLGVFIQAMMTGIIFAKLSLPKRRAHTIMFSRLAVISQRDGEHCLMFRVGDIRRSHFINTSIRALLVKDRCTAEGETIPLCQYPLDIQTDINSTDNFVFLVWPIIAVHRINQSSPLYDISAQSLQQQHFEIIVILEGTIESTGMSTQVRTSYLPSEIRWAHRPSSLHPFLKDNGSYTIDYTVFNELVPTPSMPDCSARTLAEQRSNQPVLQPPDPVDLDIPRAKPHPSPLLLPPPVPARTGRSRAAHLMRRVRASVLPRGAWSSRRSLSAGEQIKSISSDEESDAIAQGRGISRGRRGTGRHDKEG